MDMKSQVKIIPMQTRKTHIERVRKTDQDLIGEICNQIGWSIERYYWHQFNNYLYFADVMFRGWPKGIKQQITYSPVFRGFWNNEAALRNAEFIPFAFDTHSIKDRVSEFLFMHDPSTLMNDDLFMMKYNATLNIIHKEEV